MTLMDDSTITALNAINRKFYEITATEFDQTRGTAWQGWHDLLPYLPEASDARLRVLDVGCGNGRFGVFLGEHTAHQIHYHGMDNNQKLLDFAQESLNQHSQIKTILEQRDIVANPPMDGNYDLVVLFGVIHHIPGYQQRQEFIRKLAGCVAKNGLLVFAEWRFYEFDRFKKRLIVWDDDLAQKVEKHDYLLDWRRGEVALRYCHYVDDNEHQALMDATGLTEIVTYRADGFTGTVNQYTVLKRATS